jgi:hypothetical protein
MSLKLSDVMRMKEREKASKSGKLKEQSAAFAVALKLKDEKLKQEANLKEIAWRNEKNLEILRQKERQREEDERRTKAYFQMDKYNRKIPAQDSPVYFGDMVEKNSAWLPHGVGQFSLNDQVLMKGDFRHGDLVQGQVNWSDGSSWSGKLIDHKMDGIGVITDQNGVDREAMMRMNILVCFKDELHNGKQIEFEEQVFNVYPMYNRKPVATIIKHVQNWEFLCKFHDEVYPQDRRVRFI